jgi:hypothetical protein
MSITDTPPGVQGADASHMTDKSGKLLRARVEADPTFASIAHNRPIQASAVNFLTAQLEQHGTIRYEDSFQSWYAREVATKMSDLADGSLLYVALHQWFYRAWMFMRDILL